jgi:uncharacterized protein (TIGR02001 family)
MKKKMIHTLVVAAMSSAPMIASAELTGNVGLSSDYVWRGLTQTAGDSAISGGLDYSAPYGLYVGTWASNTSFGSPELDLYGGYAAEFGGVGIDVGYIGYLYPGIDDDPATATADEGGSLDWAEAYVGVSWKMLSLTYSFSEDTWNTRTDSSYIDLSAEFDVGKDLKLAVHVGKYDFDADDLYGTSTPNNPAFVWDDYTDYSLSLSKGDFTITYSDTNLDDETLADATAYGNLDGSPPNVDYYAADDDYKVYISYSKEF